MKPVQITFSHYFDKSEIKNLEEKVGLYNIQVNQFEKAPENIGGIISLGIVMFIASEFASGFFSELGKDTYVALKKKLFHKKQQLEKSNIEKFTVNINFPAQYGIAVFNLTNLNEEQFLKGLNQINSKVDQLLSDDIKDMMMFNFNTAKETWELDCILD